MANKSKKIAKQSAPAPSRGGAAKIDAKALNKEISNALFSDEERAGMFFAKNWKLIAALAVLAVLAVTGGFAWYRHNEAVKLENTAKLANAKKIDEIEKALAVVPADIPGVDDARFRLAKLYGADKKYDKARAVLKALAASTRDVASRDRAKLDIAYSLELEGKRADAAKSFAAVARDTTVAQAARAEAGYAAGRLYVDLKQNDDAKKALTIVRGLKIKKDEQPGTAGWQMLARNLEATIN